MWSVNVFNKVLNFFFLLRYVSDNVAKLIPLKYTYNTLHNRTIFRKLNGRLTTFNVFFLNDDSCYAVSFKTLQNCFIVIKSHLCRLFFDMPITLPLHLSTLASLMHSEVVQLYSI